MPGFFYFLLIPEKSTVYSEQIRTGLLLLHQGVSGELSAAVVVLGNLCLQKELAHIFWKGPGRYFSIFRYCSPVVSVRVTDNISQINVACESTEH